MYLLLPDAVPNASPFSFDVDCSSTISPSNPARVRDQVDSFVIVPVSSRIAAGLACGLYGLHYLM